LPAGRPLFFGRLVDGLASITFLFLRIDAFVIDDLFSEVRFSRLFAGGKVLGFNIPLPSSGSLF